MNKLSLCETKRLHRELWWWVECRPLMKKKYWPRWHINGGDLARCESNCFACKYDRQKETMSELCNFCPIYWPGDRCDTMIIGDDHPYSGVWTRYELAKEDGDFKKAKRLARAIRLMPWNDEVSHET